MIDFMNNSMAHKHSNWEQISHYSYEHFMNIYFMAQCIIMPNERLLMI